MCMCITTIVVYKSQSIRVEGQGKKPSSKKKITCAKPQATPSSGRLSQAALRGSQKGAHSTSANLKVGTDSPHRHSTFSSMEPATLQAFLPSTSWDRSARAAALVFPEPFPYSKMLPCCPSLPWNDDKRLKTPAFTQMVLVHAAPILLDALVPSAETLSVESVLQVIVWQDPCGTRGFIWIHASIHEIWSTKPPGSRPMFKLNQAIQPIPSLRLMPQPFSNP